MTEDLRSLLYDLARWCKGFTIKKDGEVESVWEWDDVNDKPKRVG